MRFIQKLSLASWCLVLAVTGCAGSVAVSGPTQRGPDTSIFWPLPPEKPRIQYLASLYGTSDMGEKKNWFGRVVHAAFGRDEAEERLLRPYGVFAGNGRVYVTDPGAHLLHVSDIKEGRLFQIKTVKGEKLISPIGVAADKNGEIFLSDSMLKRVLVFDKDGTYLRDIGSEKIFARPAGIAVDESRVYVVDAHAHQVSVFGKRDGDLLFSFGKNGAGKGDFNFPTNISVSRDGLLHVMDSMNFRVQIFGRDGDFVSVFGKLGDGQGDFSKAKGIAVDSEGHIYVADAHFNSIQIFDREGKLLLIFGDMGSGQGELLLPAGIFIDEKDRLYVADSYNSRVQIFQYLKHTTVSEGNQ